MLVERAAREEEQMMVRSAAVQNKQQIMQIAQKPPLHPSNSNNSKNKVLGFSDMNIDDNASVTNSHAIVSVTSNSLQSSSAQEAAPQKPKKVYAREEGEWRKDRTWISQRSLDRTARKIAEEKARNVQVQRQKEEDEFIDGKVSEKEDVMKRYFQSVEGHKMIDAVVDELKDLSERIPQIAFTP